MANGRGGARPGAGRKKGGRNRLTEEARQIAKKTGITPLEFLLEAMQDDSLPLDKRIDAAKAAAPYVHPKLSSVEVSGDPERPMRHVIEQEIIDPNGQD